MAMTKVHVWHDIDGKIVAVGRAIGSAKCLPGATAKHFVIEIEIEETEISSLHQTHMIDPLQKIAVEAPSI